MSTLKEKYIKEVKGKLSEELGITNPMQIPKIEKIILHRGLGEAVSNSKVVDSTVDVFARITGQKPIVTKAKKAISNFKLREGQIIGCKATLRSDKMYDFLTKLINIALPKIRDFRGVSRKSFDGRGNYTMGLKEELIFPEVDYNKIDKPRGFDITIVTSADKDDDARLLLELMGMPFVRKRNG